MEQKVITNMGFSYEIIQELFTNSKGSNDFVRSPPALSSSYTYTIYCMLSAGAISKFIKQQYK